MKITFNLVGAKALSCVLSCAIAAVLFADDVVVTEVTTIGANANYGRLLVNADLTVAAGVTLTCDSVCIASNIVGSAKLTLEEGARLVVTRTESRSLQLGADGGQAWLVLKSGSNVTADSLYGAYGYESLPSLSAMPTRSHVVMNDATLTLNGTAKDGDAYRGLFLSGGGNWPSGTAATEVVDEIQMNGASVMYLKRIEKNSIKAAKLLFNGGKIVTNGNTGSPYGGTAFITLGSAAGTAKSPLYAEGTNNCAISFSNGHGAHSFCHMSSQGCIFTFQGDGDIEKNGAWTIPLNKGSNWKSAEPNIRFLHAGKIRIMDGGWEIYNSFMISNSVYSTAHDWEIASGAKLDLRGCNAIMKSLYVHGGGVLTNSQETVSELALGAENADVVYQNAVSPRINMRKIGTGVLRLFAGDMGAIQVDEGEVQLLSRKEIGYPFYKFNAYATRYAPASNTRVRIAEFKFLNCMDDVTQGWSSYYYDHTGTLQYNEPANMWDGRLDTEFYDQRAQNYATISNIHVELEYVPSRKITGYTWATVSNGTLGDLSAWEVFGSLDNVNWTSLDRVENYTAPSARGEWVGTNFVFRFEDTVASVGTLNLSSGTKLATIGADVDFSSVSISPSAAISITEGGRMVLPANTEVANIDLDADAVDVSHIVGMSPASDGSLAITGSGKKPPKELPLFVVGTADAVWNGWTVTYNGESVKYAPKIFNGRMTLQSTAGFIISFK